MFIFMRRACLYLESQSRDKLEDKGGGEEKEEEEEGEKGNAIGGKVSRLRNADNDV